MGTWITVSIPIFPVTILSVVWIVSMIANWCISGEATRRKLGPLWFLLLILSGPIGLIWFLHLLFFAR